MTKCKAKPEPDIQWYKGSLFGLDPLKEYRVTDMHFDVNGKFGGVLATMVHIVDRDGKDGRILVYHLMGCYEDVLPQPLRPTEIVARSHPKRRYLQPTLTDGPRIDRCRHEFFTHDPRETWVSEAALEDTP